MARSRKPEFWDYRVGHPEEASYTKEPLTKVSHVTHVDSAISILTDGVLRPRLVYDKSKLNDRRILVNWVSPNDWTDAGGFRYGSVSFTFDWKRLIAGMRYYWVEVIDYKPKALRILVTPNRYRKSVGLVPYDPAADRGPWQYNPKTEEHLWNAKYCLEIMVERELELVDSLRTEFVRHGGNAGCVQHTPSDSCSYWNKSAAWSGGIFLAGILAKGLDPMRLAGIEDDSKAGPARINGQYR